MFARSKGGFELSIEKTKKLNDTAVEYIGGIEVIKAFGKTGSSYEKFVTAAREGADVFMRNPNSLGCVRQTSINNIRQDSRVLTLWLFRTVQCLFRLMIPNS